MDFAVMQMMTGPYPPGIYSQVLKTGITKTSIKIWLYLHIVSVFIKDKYNE